MTLMNVSKDLLMFPPSFRRIPVAPVESARSLPAKSTRFILLTVSLGILSTILAWANLIVNMACDRLLVSFMLVEAVVRLMLPRLMSSSMSK